MTLASLVCICTEHKCDVRFWFKLMLEKKFIKENLEKTYCHKCGASLGSAKISPITEASIVMIAHAVCLQCQAESMVTITTSGTGSVPLISDMSSDEMKKFVHSKLITYDEIIDLHHTLKKENIWKLMHKKEPISAKKLKK